MQMKLKTIALLAILAFASRSAIAQQSAMTMASPEKPLPSDAKANTPSLNTSFRDRYPRYKIEAGDVFDIAFELSPEFNQTVTVQPDGFITLRGVGDVHVASQTVPELTQTIRTAYDKILHEPLVSITLKDFQKPYFIADGQVGRPGKYELRGDTTLTEAIAMAGGFQDTAKHSQVLLFRRVSDQWTSAQVFNIKKMHNQHDLREDPLLHPGDMLFVPKNRVSKIKPWLPTSSVGTFASSY